MLSKTVILLMTSNLRGMCRMPDMQQFRYEPLPY